MEFSSVLDFARFVEFMQSGDPCVLSSAMWTALRSRQAPTHLDGSVNAYGYGVFDDSATDFGPGQFVPGRVLDHSGAQPGWTSYWHLNTDDGFGFVLFQNSDGGAGFTNTFLYALTKLAGYSLEREPASLLPDPSAYPSYVGDYLDATQLGAVTVAEVNGTVTLTVPALGVAGTDYDPNLVPVRRDNFSFDVGGQSLEVTFVRDASGKVKWLRGFDAFVAERVAGDAGP